VREERREVLMGVAGVEQGHVRREQEGLLGVRTMGYYEVNMGEGRGRYCWGILFYF
jgi:hypothetical protein